MKNERQKSELESAIETLASRGINTSDYTFRLEEMEIFDPNLKTWVTKTFLVKEKVDCEVRYPIQKNA
ncbi:MAG: hypothetical protein HYV90_02050 [Candidatus Woesebacteria bacterium]|nr:MAG: hypothetical protein HYV90_02050 [Candidatus Woesebacteria bacterium]